MLDKLVSVTKKILNFNKSNSSFLRLPVRKLDQIVPGHEFISVILVDYQYTYGDMPADELITLVKIVRFYNPERIMEIGTYLGNTTLQLAANSTAQVFTLDLNPKHSKKAQEYQILDPELDVFPVEPGIKFKKSNYSSRIKQLYGNSYTYNFDKYKGKIDLLFIDGSHHYKYVYKDTLNALKMVSPQGVIIWHDYAPYAPGVVKVLDNLGKKIPLFHIKNTSLALYKQSQ